ncbi:MAG: hypothetical protein ACW99J_20265 [Candidatus Thorarchaeota archaeon]|jgi:hypothetical protein
MSARKKDEEPKYVAVCIGCTVRFEVPKAMFEKIKEDEYVDFDLDMKTKRSLLVATVYLPRCPQCTGAIMNAVERKKPKANAPIMLFETETTKDEAEDTSTPKVEPSKAETPTS